MIRIIYNSLRTKTNVFIPYKIMARNGSVTTWNKDWKPGPYPRTEEERVAAAKKYNMLPEDYEPYPEEEGYGDYPKFEAYHAETRDPFGVYDFEFLKRNYGEPVHPDADVCVEDKVNFQRKFRTPLKKQVLYLAAGVTLYTTIMLLDEMYHIPQALIPKQYPLSGQVHYTFDPEN